VKNLIFYIGRFEGRVWPDDPRVPAGLGSGLGVCWPTWGSGRVRVKKILSADPHGLTLNLIRSSLEWGKMKGKKAWEKSWRKIKKIQYKISSGDALLQRCSLSIIRLLSFYLSPMSILLFHWWAQLGFQPFCLMNQQPRKPKFEGYDLSCLVFGFWLR